MSNTFFCHPQALVETRDIGEGCRVWAFAHVMDGARIGRDCNICDNVFVETGVEIGDRVTVKNNVFVCKGVVLNDDVFVGPGAVFTNDRFPRSARMPAIVAEKRTESDWLERTVINRGVSVGANATVLCGIEVGEYAMIGAGAIVRDDVSQFACVVGCPARRVGYVCICGHRLSFDKSVGRCCQCKRVYELRRCGDAETCRLRSEE